MESEGSGRLSEHFADLPDPRIERTKLHKLFDIVMIAICADPPRIPASTPKPKDPHLRQSISGYFG